MFKEGHTAPQAAAGVPLNHSLITYTSFSSVSGGEDGKAWPERKKHRHALPSGTDMVGKLETGTQPSGTFISEVLVLF